MGIICFEIILKELASLRKIDILNPVMIRHNPVEIARRMSAPAVKSALALTYDDNSTHRFVI